MQAEDDIFPYNHTLSVGVGAHDDPNIIKIPFVSSWAEKISQCDVFVVEPDHRKGAKRDLERNTL